MQWISNAWCRMLTAATVVTLSSYTSIVEASEASPHLYTVLTESGEMLILSLVGGPHGSTEMTLDGYSVSDCKHNQDGVVRKCYNVLDPATGDAMTSNVEVSNNIEPEKMGIAKGMHIKTTPYGQEEEEKEDSRLLTGNTEEEAQKMRRTTTGNIKNLVIPIRFSNHRNRDLPSRADIEVLMNSEVPDESLCPTGSVKEYFRWASFDELNLDSVVLDWVDVPQTEAYYANNGSGLTDKTHMLIKEALNIVGESTNFQTFDGNDDNIIDAITFLHSGYGAEWGGEDAYGTGYADRIWSHQWQIHTIPIPERTFDGVQVYNYHISPAVWGTAGTAIGHIGVIVHETGRFLGLPDLYDTDGTGEGIGSWDVMANSWGFDGSQKYPPKMSPWTLVQAGWLRSDKIDTISASGSYEVFPAHTGGLVYKISAGFADGEYLYIENREKDRFDGKIPDSGLAIFHIDEQMSNHNTEGYPGQDSNTWPRNNKHYKNAILQQDGKYDLERGNNRGGPGDIYRPGHSISHSTSSSGPHPNTDSYQGGNVQKTFYTIDNIVSVPGSANFRFTLSNSNIIVTSAPTKAPTPPPALKPVGSDCASDSECRSGHCKTDAPLNEKKCYSINTDCDANGSQCSSDSQCCSGLCNTNSRCG